MAQQLSYAELEGYWISAGGPANVAPEAAAIALAESSGEYGSIQQGQLYKTTGWGLWQITPGNSVPQVGTDQALLDPAVNAQAAVAKYEAAGNSFKPWTTYTSGKYLHYLQQDVSPARVEASPATLTSSVWDNIPGAGIVGGAISAGSETASLLGKLVSVDWWKRVGKMALAILLGLVSASFLFSKTTTGENVSNVGKQAAMVAAL